ncbi:MAG: phosphate ABC transporter permease PstA, partial [Alphaproteobacteria bacterium]|nr:phosphate ABC transporter permease PstA [Alphaproteobacteria bacterium]
GLNMLTLTKDSGLIAAQDPNGPQLGGLYDGIVGSLVMSILAMVAALFIGIFAGTWLAEYAGESHTGNIIRFLNDVLLSAPSILVGLAVYTYIFIVMTWHNTPQYTYSGLAGAAALAILALPVIVRTTEDMLLLQPAQLREAGVALGASRGLVIRQIIWRAARTGLLTGGLLAFARISGETAPLLFTAFGNGQSIALRHFISGIADKTSALPLLINSLYQSPLTVNFAWTAALLISLAVLAVNILGRFLARGSRHS